MKIHTNPFKFLFVLVGYLVISLLIIFSRLNTYNNSQMFLGYASQGTVFKQFRLWQLITEFQVKNNGKASIESAKVCTMANKRIVETRTDWSHNGFYAHTSDFSYTKIGENIIKGYGTEQSTLQGWLNSPLHKKNLTDNYKYSCLRCEGDRCVQIFANF